MYMDMCVFVNIGMNQDSVDLFLGLYTPSIHSPSPYQLSSNPNHASHQKSFLSFFIRFFLVLLVLMVALTIILPPSVTPYRHWNVSTQLYAFVFIFMIAASKLLLRYGRAYVNKPIFRN